jgi:exodeoxyribonuclease VII large subunit
MPELVENIREYISVSDLTGRINYALEEEVGEVFFQGEISEIKKAASGHIYFCIKDEKSQISAVMWKGMQHSLKFEPKPGILVLCHGRPTIYHVSGKFQIVVHFMALAGEGDLQKKFLELKEKLEKEGLFSLARKRPIPFWPATLGIITSPTGAVIHDIMIKIAERMPHQKTFLIGVRVQGAGASKEISDAISYFNEKKLVDVIILARGGGSLEDLWAFNEEKTVRAVFASEIPIICGVGHETDITLADLVADLRAPTPTAAAEFSVPKKSDLLNLVNDYEKRIRNFSRWLAPLIQRVDEITFKLNAKFKILIQHNKMRLPAITSALQRLATKTISSAHTKLETLSAKLEAYSPLRVLERGYSITEYKGKILKDASKVKSGDKLEIILHEGRLAAKVEKPG